MGQDPLIGTDVKQAFDEVLNAKQALVVSPWIQEPYASALMKMVMEGRAKVITSMDKENAFYTLLGNISLYTTTWLLLGIALSAIGAIILVPSITMLLVPLLAPFASNYLQPLGWVGVAGILFSLVFLAPGVYYILKHLRQRRMLREKPWLSNVRLSPPLGQDGFIHIKLYIADDKAWVGSANMTVSAWKHNIETLVPIDLETAMRIFEKAWSTAKPPGG